MFTTLACNLTSAMDNGTATRDPCDTFFFGHAFIDANGNRELDDSDPPLKGRSSPAAGFGARPEPIGVAAVVIPGGWNKPVEAQMAPPTASGYKADRSIAVPAKPHRDECRLPFCPAARIPTNQTGSLPTPPRLQIDLTYCTTTDGVKLTMDLYQPREMADWLGNIICAWRRWTSGIKRRRRLAVQRRAAAQAVMQWRRSTTAWRPSMPSCPDFGCEMRSPLPARQCC